MVCLFSRFKRKGFMHALEGIIAAIVLFFYFSSASLPPLQTNDWTQSSIKQSGSEYMNSIGRSDISEQLAKDSRVFSKITNSLFETADISIVENGIPPKDLRVGLLGTYAYYYIQNITINERKTSIRYNAIMDLSDDDLSQYDVILITDPEFIIGDYAPKLKKFLLSGRGIVEVINLTALNYDTFQSDLFGLENKENYGIIGGDGTTYLTEDVRSISEPIKIKSYFSGIPIRVDMHIASPPYDVSDLPEPSTVRVGVLNLTSGEVNLAIAKSGVSYTNMYIDSNGDRNFSKPLEDSTPHSIGESFNTSSLEYIIKSVDTNGAYADVRPSSNTTLMNFFNPLKLAPDKYSWASAIQGNTYNFSNNSLGYSFDAGLSTTPIIGDYTTLLGGDHTYGQITFLDSNLPDAPYDIAVTAIYDSLPEEYFFNIDLNRNLKYNDSGEGPFSSTELVKIGSENYRITMADSSSVTFTLHSRDFVSAAIAGDKNIGRTVWMPDMANKGIDSWSYITAAVVWAAPKNNGPYGALKDSNRLSNDNIFILSEDIFQPYFVEFSRRYG